MTDKQIQEIRYDGFSIFQRKIYLNTMDDVQAVVEVLKKKIDLMILILTLPASAAMTDQQRSAVEAPLAAEKAATQEVEGLHRRLSQRQLTMMAIGGAIGVGLFLGSSVTIRLAGPAVILSYLLGAGIALIMSYALAEMAVVHPVAGAFGVYAETYLNPWAGFSVRATYGVAQIIAIGAEVTAAGIYISFWFPNVPQWIWVVLVSAALVALNSMQVNRLGEFEYWFAMIKVAAIVAFIIVGLS